jgi:hypothetical protein
MLAHKLHPSADHTPVALSADTRRKNGTRRGQGLLFRPPGQASRSVQVAIKEEQKAMVDLYYKLQQGHRGSECDDPHADATQQRSQVRAQGSSVHDQQALVAGIEGGGLALEQSGDRVPGTQVFGKKGAAGQMEEDEESLFDEVLVQLLVSRQSEVSLTCLAYVLLRICVRASQSTSSAIRCPSLTVSCLCLCGGVQLQDLSSRDAQTSDPGL